MTKADPVGRSACRLSICDAAITSVRTGNGKLLTAAGPDLILFPCVASKNELVTSATRSDALATAKAARKLGTTATTARLMIRIS
jgi:hypothetical protein